MSTAREHAIIASELLDSERKVEDEISNLTPEQQLQHAVSGTIRQMNENRIFTIKAAQAHALAAIALQLTERR